MARATANISWVTTSRRVNQDRARFSPLSFRFLSSFVILLLSSGFLAAASPQLEINEPVWSFGPLTNVPAVTHQFIVRNTGDSELLITKVLSSCEACLQASADHDAIAPGGLAVLK